jgi:hypothetical protein
MVVMTMAVIVAMVFVMGMVVGMVVRAHGVRLDDPGAGGKPIRP